MDGLHQIGADEFINAARFLGVLYAEDFDASESARSQPPLPEPAPVEASFTLAQLEAAQADARRDAVRTARAEWEASATHARSQSLTAIAASLAAAQDGARLLAEEVAGETSRAVLSILAALLPHLCRLHGDTEVRALLRHLLPQLALQPRITVRVHASALDGVRQDLRSLDENIAASVTLTALDTLDFGDARVGWTSGALHRDSNAIAGALRAALTELGLLEVRSNPASTNQRLERRMSLAD